MKLLTRFAFALMCLAPLTARAQEPLKVPSSGTEPEGFIAEPDAITRAVLFADRHLGKGDLTNGIYVDYGGMIPGTGWLSAGPGYRRWFKKDTLFLNASGSISVNADKVVQARAELPSLLKSRLLLGAHARWQDFRSIDYFGRGPTTSLDRRTEFGIKSTQATGYATVRPVRWLSLTGQAGVLTPETFSVEGRMPLPEFATEERRFMLSEVSAALDARDFDGHPTRGVLLRAAAARYEDRTSGIHTFDRRDAEAALFVPFGGARVVLALHGWVVETEPRSGNSVPFYMQPTLGGVTTLRSYTDYRFRDTSMAVANAELRFALLSHLDLAAFVDAGNVAPRLEDLDLAKRSAGAGLRLHTRRETFAMLDFARGDEGWRFSFRLSDPLRLQHLTRRAVLVPFVP